MATKGEPITTKFSVDISELKAGIQEANREIRLANSEFKAASSGMDDWGNSADGLQAKLEQLAKVQDAENKKLQLLQKQYAAVAEEQGENSAAAQNLQIKINNQQAAVNKTAAEFSKYEQKLNDINSATGETGDAVDDQRSAYEKLQDTIKEQEKALSDLKAAYANAALEQGESSDEARDLASQIGSLSSELSENKKKMDDVNSAADSLDNSMDDLGNSAGEAEGGFTILKGALAEFAGNFITGAVSKIKDFVGSIFQLSEATEEYRSMMAKVSGSADSFGYSIDFAKGKYAEFYEYLGDDQMSTNAITNLMGMKVSTDTVSDAADAAIAVWSAYGDSIPIEGLTESINESAQVAKVTGSLADTINWAARSNEDWSKAMAGHSDAQEAFNEAVANGETQEDAYSAALAACADTQERAELIAQTLNQTYGKSKTTYDAMTQSTREANVAELALKDSQAQLGAAIEPVNTAITNLKTQAIDAITPVVTTLATKFGELLTWLQQNPAAMAAVQAGVTALATAMGVLAAALGISALINAVQKAFVLLNATMLANPIVLIVSLIAGLVAAIVSLWNTNEGFRNALTGIWEAIKSAISTAIDAIVGFFTETVPAALSAMLDWFAQLPGNIWNFLVSAATNIANWASDVASKALETGQTFLDNVINFIKELPGKVWNWLTQTVTKVVTWGAQMVSKAQENSRNFIDKVIEFVKQLPGKVWTWLTNTISKVVTWGTQMVTKAQENSRNFINKVVEFIKQLPDKVWTWLTNVISKVTTWGTNMVSKAKTAASNMVNGVIDFIKSLPGKIANLLTGAANKVVSWGTNLASKGKAAASKLFNAVVNGVTSLPGKMLEIGSNIVNGVWNGIQNAAGAFASNVKNFFSGIVSGAKSALGIASPSRVFRDEVGKQIPPGVAEGIDDAAAVATKSVAKMNSDMIAQARKAANAKLYEIAGNEVGSGYISRLKKSLQTAKNDVAAMVNSTIPRVSSNDSGSRQVVNNYNMTQNNTSPKALSRLEIYRQTKNLLKGAAIGV